VVPANKIINDNHGQHYRIHQGNLDWLTYQFNEILNGERVAVQHEANQESVVQYGIAPCGFAVPKPEEAVALVEGGKFLSLRCEVWRPREYPFDPQNYAKTFKAPIDLLVKNGHIKDDNWKYVSGITYIGGGPSVWKGRAWRFENDGLPEDLTPEWWYTVANDYGDIFVRILASAAEQ
jgi:hypothetical protein